MGEGCTYGQRKHFTGRSRGLLVVGCVAGRFVPSSGGAPVEALNEGWNNRWMHTREKPMRISAKINAISNEMK